uniref:Uncharacterized protein n=1 Tax=Romanomermis culicivorax TaxID=13658 RepID=A0A915L460_ROMCU
MAKMAFGDVLEAISLTSRTTLALVLKRSSRNRLLSLTWFPGNASWYDDQIGSIDGRFKLIGTLVRRNNGRCVDMRQIGSYAGAEISNTNGSNQKSFCQSHIAIAKQWFLKFLFFRIVTSTTKIPLLTKIDFPSNQQQSKHSCLSENLRKVDKNFAKIKCENRFLKQGRTYYAKPHTGRKIELKIVSFCTRKQDANDVI